MAIKDINDARKWDKFCDRLIELTTSGKIGWSDWSHRIQRSDNKTPLFVTEYKGWYILIFKYDYKYFFDEERYEWSEDIAIELIDSDGRNLWTLPQVPSRKKLLGHVQFANADVESLLNDVLDNDEEQ
jgi:hypothetical protein